MGKELKVADDFDPATLLMPLLMLVAMAGMMTLIVPIQNANAYYVSQLYEGKNDPRFLKARHLMQSISLSPPWIGAFFINHGPDDVMIGINQKDRMFTMLAGGTRTIDRSGAEERISSIYYFCDIGKTAIIEVTGEY